MELRIKRLKQEAKLPEYANKGDAGMDLFHASDNKEDVVIASGARGLLSTGLAMEIPEGCVGLVWDKSGIATKTGLQTIGGVIDSGYRGEIKVAVFNSSSSEIVIRGDQKIAQLLIQNIENPTIVETDDIWEATERGVDGFGSTGV